MKINYKNIGLSKYEEDEITECLGMLPDNIPDQLGIWYLLDEVWEAHGCNNVKLDADRIRRFYSHPVWLLTGLFIEQDQYSLQQRRIISDWVIQNTKNFGLRKIVDYGGGFGTLARLIAEKDRDLRIEVFEPHPTDFAKKRLDNYPNAYFVSALGQDYDVLLSTDVLEHVGDSLKALSEMVQSVRSGGYLIIAHNFTPIIKCHLPRTFHLRYTFDVFAKMMGLNLIESFEGTHATLYKRDDWADFNWFKIRLMEKFSKLFFPFLRGTHFFYRSAMRLLI